MQAFIKSIEWRVNGVLTSTIHATGKSDQETRDAAALVDGYFKALGLPAGSIEQTIRRGYRLPVSNV
jgi:hypothetical protein